MYNDDTEKQDETVQGSTPDAPENAESQENAESPKDGAGEGEGGLKRETNRKGIANPQVTKDYPFISDKRVLVVEDTTPMRRMMSNSLKKAGALVDEAENGEEALKMMRRASRHEEPYDLVTLDLMMPVMNGGDCLAEIRNDLNIKDMRVIIVSSRSDSATVLGAAKLGILGYIRKPYKINKIFEAVNDALGGAEEKARANAEAEAKAHVEECEAESESPAKNENSEPEAEQGE
ncbi:MAG: response regulator [Planctomycetes bacterium]|nr:response regulator [Planctomycetota bacterium]